MAAVKNRALRRRRTGGSQGSPQPRYSRSDPEDRPCVLAQLSQGGSRVRPSGDWMTLAAADATLPTTAGLAPRYWRKRIAEQALEAAAAPEPAEPPPAEAEPVGAPHSVDEVTPELRHHIIEDEERKEHRRHVRVWAELLAMVTVVGLAVLVGKAFAGW